jgi:protoporphyrinogen oxidase
LKKIVIIGAGLTGLSTAYALHQHQEGYSVALLERENRPGGLCRTVRQDGFLFDQTGHLLHFGTEQFKKFVQQKLPDGLVEKQRNSWVYSHDVYTRYPFQANLYGLPPEVLTECLYGYCEAVFRPPARQIESFEDWILAHLGPGIGRHFMVPYNTKLYKRHPSKLTPECIGRFVPKPDPLRVIRGAVSDYSENLGYNSTFFYPKQGGIETLIHSIAQDMPNLHTGQAVRAVDLKHREVLTASREIFSFDLLVSTVPLPVLVKMLSDAPRRVRDAAKRLEHVSVLNVNLGIRGNIGDKHWIYVPEERYLFYRIGFAHNFTDCMAPPGHSSIYAEICYTPGDILDVDRTVRQVISDLLAMKVIPSRKDVVSQAVIDIPYAYVIFNHCREEALSIIRSFLSEQGIFSVGRFGRWEYTSMEDSFMDGMATAVELRRKLDHRRG